MERKDGGINIAVALTGKYGDRFHRILGNMEAPEEVFETTAVM